LHCHFDFSFLILDVHILISRTNALTKNHKEKSLLTVRITDPQYNSALIGNGEIVTVIGPTGYHNGFCPEDEQSNRVIVWAGRRLRDSRTAKIRIPRVAADDLMGPIMPLIRFGRIMRTLKIDGFATADDQWEQTMEMDSGQVISRISHGSIEETTESLVCLEYNMLVFHTTLRNNGHQARELEFETEYQFGDAEGLLAEGTRLKIRRPHPDDLEFGNVEGIRSRETDLEHRPPHELESLSLQYEIEGHLGEVHWGRYPNGVIKETKQGGRFIHQIRLDPGAFAESWFWATVSDRDKFSRVQNMLAEHRQAWEDFWSVSNVTLGDEKLNAIRKSCLYTLRCNASPWTIPPGYFITHWEGRIFHDEFYSFMALVSGNQRELAERITNYRLSTLPVALRRGHGNGAHFGWEVTETGEESAPYGHWVDEQFRHGQIFEQAWRYYLHTGSLEDLERFYPVLQAVRSG